MVEQGSDSDKQVTASQVTLKARIRLDDASKIGKYSCTAHDAAGNSGSGEVTMQVGGGGQHFVPVVPVHPGHTPPRKLNKKNFILF